MEMIRSLFEVAYAVAYPRIDVRSRRVPKNTMLQKANTAEL